MTAFVVAFIIQWKLTLITITIVPTIIIVVAICITISRKYDTQQLAIYSKAGLLAEEVFSTVRTVHAFWLNPYLSRKYDKFIDEAMVVGLKHSPVYSFLFSVEFFCVYCGYGLAFWRGIRMFVSGEITESGRLTVMFFFQASLAKNDAGDVFTVILAVIVAASSMSALAPQSMSLTKASASAAELFSTIDRKSEIDPLTNEGKVPTSCIGDIEIENITFAYPARPDTTILKNFTLSAPANKTTAIVGASGSGKSTIIGLLERWYDQPSGTIYLDGVDIRELNLTWLRTSIRLVQQEPVLFSGTVYENVAYGLYGTNKVRLPEHEQRKLVEKACDDAYATEFINRLPNVSHIQNHLAPADLMKGL